jgi:protein TonB
MKTSKTIFLVFTLFTLTKLPALGQISDQVNKVYTYLYVDKIPEFNGGAKKLKQFLDQNLKWPDSITDIQGTVLLSFIVSDRGNITDIKVEKTLLKSFDDEAKRVIMLMPKWIPGTLDNHYINVKIYFPIDFKINK